MQVTREFSFEAAHMLSGYEGPCSNLHGHSYKLQVTLVGQVQQCPKASDDMMVTDFRDMKYIVEREVIKRLDHAVIFSDSTHRDESEECLYRWAVAHKKRHIVLPWRCTAESIAEYIRVALKRAFADTGAQDVKIRLWETANSFVEV